MSIISQFFEYNDLCTLTRLQLFAEGYRAFNASLYKNDEDPDVSAWGKRAEVRLQEIEHIFRILGIYEDFQATTEEEVTEALENYPA